MLPEVKTKEVRDNLVLFHRFYELLKDINYVMKYIGEVPQLYSKECNDNRCFRLGNNHQGLYYDRCHNFLKSYYQNSLFYAGDGMVASSDLRWLQGEFSTLVGLSDKVGLRNNVGKTVGMVCRTCQATGTQLEVAYR